VTGQIIVNVLLATGQLLPIALGFALIHRTSRCLHFAHGAVCVIAPYLALTFSAVAGFPLCLAVVAGIAAAAVAGAGIEFFCYRPMRRRGSSSLSMALVSLGLLVAIQNTISLAYGDGAQRLRPWAGGPGMEIWGGRITGLQVAAVCCGFGCVIVLAALERATRWGKAIRAVAINPNLARVCGIESSRVVLSAFLIGSGLAGVSGVWIALDVDMMPTIGLGALMMSIVAAVAGGHRTLFGPAVSLVALMAILQAAGLLIGAEWQEAVAFAILIGVLLLRHTWGAEAGLRLALP